MNPTEHIRKELAAVRAFNASMLQREKAGGYDILAETDKALAVLDNRIRVNLLQQHKIAVLHDLLVALGQEE